MQITPYQMAERFNGLKEVAGSRDNHQIMAMLTMDYNWPKNDEVAWCSAFTNYVNWLLRLPRSKSLMAQSWLSVGFSVVLKDAQVGYDVVVLSRPGNPKWGHVGYYSGQSKTNIFLLGGNQSNSVDVSGYDIGRVLGVRRIM